MQKDDRLEILNRGREFAALKAQPGFARLIVAMEDRAVNAANAYRQSKSSDPTVEMGLARKWREAEESLDFLRATVEGGIEDMEAILEEGKSAEELEEMLLRHEMEGEWLR